MIWYFVRLRQDIDTVLREWSFLLPGGGVEEIVGGGYENFSGHFGGARKIFLVFWGGMKNF